MELKIVWDQRDDGFIYCSDQCDLYDFEYETCWFNLMKDGISGILGDDCPGPGVYELKMMIKRSDNA